MSGVRYPARVRIAALRLSQEIGRRNAALSLNVTSASLGNWRHRAGMPHLPRRVPDDEVKAECAWCGRARPRPGFCTPGCRRAYIDDAWKEKTTHATKQ